MLSVRLEVICQRRTLGGREGRSSPNNAMPKYIYRNTYASLIEISFLPLKLSSHPQINFEVSATVIGCWKIKTIRISLFKVDLCLAIVNNSNEANKILVTNKVESNYKETYIFAYSLYHL